MPPNTDDPRLGMLCPARKRPECCEHGPILLCMGLFSQIVSGLFDSDPSRSGSGRHPRLLGGLESRQPLGEFAIGEASPRDDGGDR